MTPDIVAQHEFDDGEVIQLLRPRYGGDYRLVGRFGGLEVPIHFDAADIQRNQLVLSREVPKHPPSQHAAAGSLEGGPADYGAVGVALARIATNAPPSELEAML